MCDTAGGARTNSWVTFFYGPLHMAVSALDDQQEIIYISSVHTQDVVLKTHRERWVIRTDKERESRKSVLAARPDDNDALFKYHCI